MSSARTNPDAGPETELDPVNPYRSVFYQRQTAWHGYRGVDDVAARHRLRERYYRWYTRDWLPESRDARVLDVGCGSGQFLWFLRRAGYRGENLVGIDLDAKQVEIARELGLNAERADAIEFLAESEGRYDLVAMLDILEHFTLAESFPLLEAIARALKPGGRIVLSVPNSDSPRGFQLFHADITHEMSYTEASLAQQLLCHDLELKATRDPWPAPVSAARVLYRGVVQTCRALESARLAALGLTPPRIWSPVFWAMAEKTG